MRTHKWLILLLSLHGASLLAQNLTPHPGRRDQTTPGIVLDTGARTAACDALIFSADGQHLLAVGDDKVVRAWAVTKQGQLVQDRYPLIRWPIFRENRGNIYCLALSPDEKRVAFGGSGLTAGEFAVAVADRNTGRLLHGSDSPPGSNEAGAIWSISFSPSGRRIAVGTDRGAVWIWDLTTEKFTKVGQFEAAQEWGNTVRLTAFVDEDRVLTVCGNGELVEWSLKAPLTKQLLHKFGNRISVPVALSPDRQWIGAVLDAQPGASQTAVELVSFPDAKKQRQVIYFSRKTEHHQIPHRLAFNADSTKLAVAVRIVGNREFDPSVKHFQERGGRIDLYDLPQEHLQAQPGPAQSLYAEALAFHPRNSNWLAVAGGDNHDVVLWDLAKSEKLGEVVQPGRCIWGVRVSQDGRRISFQTQRHPAAPSPNERGQGDWKTFSLADLAFVDDPSLTVESMPMESEQWEVLTTEDHGRTTQQWRVRHKASKKTLTIPLSPSNDELPRCYAFLPPTPCTRHERLLVGHYWGASLFQLDPEADDGAAAPRIRYLRGHEGYVTALAIAKTENGIRLVTASRDMTLAGWTLDDWPHHPRLGGELFVRGGKLVVGQLATGSPLWEMGVETGDELVSLARADDDVGRIQRVEVFNFDQQPPQSAASVRKLLQENLRPGREHVLTWRRPNNPTLYGSRTTLLDRPLWRFFPHNERDWVLWQWRDHYYAASTRGENNVGWQASYTFASKQQPKFYKASQLQAEFRKPDRLRKTLNSWTANQGLVEFNKLLPPRVEVGKLLDHEGEISVTVHVRPQGSTENQQPRRFLVWLNDYLLLDEELPAQNAVEFQRQITIPREKLRTGPNLISAQCYARSGARGDAEPIQFTHQPPMTPRRSLYGLIVGINDYSRTLPRQVSLKAASDAKVLARALQRQSSRQEFQQVQVHLLTDNDATRQSLFDGLRQLQSATKPDDLLVLYLGGHGTSKSKLRESKRTSDEKLQGVGKYLFLLANANVDRLPDTTISYEELQAELVKIPCHKLVLLDTCHSGEAKLTADNEDSNPIQLLREHGVGPVILAACAADQSAIETTSLDVPNGGFGLFTIALRRILEDRLSFQQADTNHDNQLTAEEFITGCKIQVRSLLANHNKLMQSIGEVGKDVQTPVEVLPLLEKGVVVVEK